MLVIQLKTILDLVCRGLFVGNYRFIVAFYLPFPVWI